MRTVSFTDVVITNEHFSCTCIRLCRPVVIVYAVDAISREDLIHCRPAMILDHPTVVHRNAYWGEFALSFAACLGQEECVRLLCAKHVDVNKQDTNGNTALHMVVIHDHQVRDMVVIHDHQVHDMI